MRLTEINIDSAYVTKSNEIVVAVGFGKVYDPEKEAEVNGVIVADRTGDVRHVLARYLDRDVFHEEEIADAGAALFLRAARAGAAVATYLDENPSDPIARVITPGYRETLRGGGAFNIHITSHKLADALELDY